MPKIRVVTDSAADIPPRIAAARGITIVPLTIRFGDTAYVDGVELSNAAFWDKLRTSADFPATAAPSAGQFEEAYRNLIDKGAEGIVSVHLSSKLSATCQSAVLGARAIPDVPIEVVDSLGVTAATGLLALHAADLADQGRTPKEIAADLEEMKGRMHLSGALDTLEYLRRGGRIGGAQALLGTMLQVKPVLALVAGEVHPAGRVRTRQKALQHLADLVRQAGPVERAVVIDGAAQDVRTFVDLVADTVRIGPDDVWSLGPVVGTHSGPGLVGIVYFTRA